ncbi:hypothetical protein [Listeria sp. PSOL-1]|uniref:hypothetical protein n=1 Tax=Listeria sp. PSOL-1 TaxID=1844999 RepID=UPI0013D6792F|nr:hypothetical protein [Listeria sp. PSOL-1]
MTFFKKRYSWALVAGGLGLLLGVYVQVITFINLNSGSYSSNLKTSLIVLTIFSFVFLLSAGIGYLFLVQKKVQLAATILLVSGLVSLFFVNILVGAAILISGILAKSI